MEAEPNPKDKVILSHIDEALEAYKEYLALDSKMALEGLKNEAVHIRTEQNGD